MALLFKNTADLKKHYPEIYKTVDFEDIKTNLRQVAQIFIEPFLGLNFLLSIAEDATASIEPTGKKGELTQSLKDAAANYFVFYTLPSKSFIVSPSGAKQPNGENNDPLSIGQIKFLQNQAIKNADSFLNRALKIIVNNPDVFTDFAPEIKAGSTLFVKYEEIENLLNLQGFRAFALISRFLRRVEDDNLLPILGKGFLEEVQIANNTKLLEVKKLAQKYVAYEALYKAIPHLSFILDGDGLKILSSLDATDKREHVSSQNQKNLDNLRAQCLKDSAEYKTALIEYLFTNKTDFATWTASNFYIKKTSGSSTNTLIIGSETGAFGIFRK
jgi:hypothetical protein